MVAVSMLAFSTFYWQYVQQDHYNQVLLNRMQREWEKLNEKVEISDTALSGSYLRFKIRNTGGVTAHIVTVYLNDTTANVARDLILANYVTSDCSVFVGPGTERWIYTTILVTPGNTYDLKVATERGNIGVISRFIAGQQGPTGVQVVPFTFSFQPADFQYKPSEDAPDPDSNGWNNAWIFTHPSGKCWFKIKLKNTCGADVQIETHTHLNLVYSAKGTGQTFESVAYCDIANGPINIPKDGEAWIVLGYVPDNKWKTGGGYADYYVFIAVFFHTTNPLGPTLGTSVSLLAIKVM
jgi:hypothetical protein